MITPTAAKPASQLVEMQASQHRTLMESCADKWSRLPGSAIRGYSKHKTVDFLEGIQSPIVRGTVGILLENAYNWLTRDIDESVRTIHIGSLN